MLYLLVSIHGVDHPVTVALHKSLELYKQYKSSIKQGVSKNIGFQLGVATFVNCYHFYLQKWYIEQWNPATTDIVQVCSRFVFSSLLFYAQ